MKKYDVIIIGGGPGGSTLGALMARQGFEVGLFEKEVFPRFCIGESLLPASMDIFRESGVYEKLDSGKYIRKFGAQFIEHTTGEHVYFNFDGDLTRNNSMAFEVPRGEFDKDLLEHAKSCGVDIHQPERVEDVSFTDDGVLIRTSEQSYEAKFLADATGRLSFLGHRLKMRHANHDLNNIAVYSHFTGVKRPEGKRAGDIIIGLLPNGGWSWTIPFQGEITSVGVVTNAAFVDKANIKNDYVENTIRTSPLFDEVMGKAKRVADVHITSNYSHTCEALFGDRFMLIGDAGLFLDPIFSSGVHMSVSSARYASRVLKRAINEKRSLREEDMGPAFEAYMRKGVKRFHSIIRMFYDTRFVEDMNHTMRLPHTRAAFTAVVAGDVWDESNVLFKMGIL